MRQYDLHQYLEFSRLQESDLSKVLEIEASVYGFPWSEKVFSSCLNSEYQCYGLWMHGELIGYCINSVVLDEAHLLNICIAKEWQGQKLGKATLFWLFERLDKEKIRQLFLEVRPSNLQALALYNSLGFETIGLRKNYYPSPEGREDALTMMKLLS